VKSFPSVRRSDVHGYTFALINHNRLSAFNIRVLPAQSALFNFSLIWWRSIPARDLILYVAPQGNDSMAGQMAEPAPDAKTARWLTVGGRGAEGPNPAQSAPAN